MKEEDYYDFDEDLAAAGAGGSHASYGGVVAPLPQSVPQAGNRSSVTDEQRYICTWLC